MYRNIHIYVHMYSNIIRRSKSFDVLFLDTFYIIVFSLYSDTYVVI